MMHKPAVLLFAAVTTLIAVVAMEELSAAATTTQWQAPASVAADTNPYSANEASRAKGAELFAQQCVVCHGASGKGDGPAGAFLGKPMPDFTKPEFQQQTDGEMYWKVSSGNAPMPTFGEILETEQLWVVVDYLRTFAK